MMWQVWFERSNDKLLCLIQTHIGGQLMHIPIEECDQYEFQSDVYFQCYIKYFSFTTHHQVGTSKMGPDSDPESVVDSRLRVRNIMNLRQIDAGM